jgi:gamma-glutamyl-gamma-aminobutyrate hydrolase PuuD
MMRGRTLKIGISARVFYPEPKSVGIYTKTLQYLEESVAHWVMSRDVLVFMVPLVDKDGLIHRSNIRLSDYAKHLDGLVLQGGADIAPESYGETALNPEWAGDRVRDVYEMELLHEFVEAGKPVLGICRGIQILNVAFGGTLYQDIATQVPGAADHRNWDIYDANRHEIDIAAGSRLADLYPGAERVTVNSVHHQAVKDVAEGFVVEAVSATDGIVEALRLPGERFVAGVQWHPEFTPVGDADQIAAEPIVDDFLAAAALAATGVQVGS